MKLITDKYIDSSVISRAKKILNLRLFEDDNGKSWNKSVLDKGYEVLCISQVCVSTFSTLFNIIIF